MKTEEAKRFVARVEADSFDETEGRPANVRMPPVSLGNRPRTRSLDDEARIKQMSSRIIAQFRERLQAANEADLLNDHLRAKLGHGLEELAAKSAAEKEAVKEELLAVVYQVHEWLTEEVKAEDTVMSHKLRKSFEEGQATGYAQAKKGFDAELHKLLDENPLARSLKEKLG